MAGPGSKVCTPGPVSFSLYRKPESAWPSFVADVYGEYIIELVVSDPWASSDPDTVTVSFNNVKPVADAGDNQAIIVGDMVNLDGSGSKLKCAHCCSDQLILLGKLPRPRARSPSPEISPCT